MEQMHELPKARVRRYFTYIAGQVVGGERSRTIVRTGLEVMKASRGWTRGLAIPYLVVNSSGSGRRAPPVPE